MTPDSTLAVTNTCPKDAVHLCQLECGVHPAKPGVCLGYPFALSRGKIVQIAEKLCPVDWEIDREVERQVSSVISEFHEEWYVYDELVSDWDAGMGLTRFRGHLTLM